jgi:hypothetical protein
MDWRFAFAIGGGIVIGALLLSVLGGVVRKA